MAAILGNKILDSNYKRHKITIAFHPIEKRFEVSNSAIKNDALWIPDIAEVLKPNISFFRYVTEYCKKNPETNVEQISDSIELLKGILNNPIGLIELNSNLDIETVTDIFIRINSQGVELSQADFAMSKIATNEKYGGNELRKCIDYFCHLAIAPEFYSQIVEADQDFAATDYFKKMQ